MIAGRPGGDDGAGLLTSSAPPRVGVISTGSVAGPVVRLPLQKSIQSPAGRRTSLEKAETNRKSPSMYWLRRVSQDGSSG